MSQNKPAPEARTRLDVMLKAWDLSMVEQDLIWRRIVATSHSPNDPAALVEALGTILDLRSQAFIEAIAQAPEAMSVAAKKAASELIEPVTKAATAKAEDQISTLAAKASVTLVETAKAAHKSSLAAQRFRISSNVAGVGLAVALGFAGAGWFAGRATISGLGEQWATLASRADAATWLELMRNNPDLLASQVRNCAPGSSLAYVVQGKRACNLPVWLEGAAPPKQGGQLVGMHYTVVDWLAGWGPLWLLGYGLVAGLLGRKFLRTIFSRGPIAWLLN